MVSLHGRMRGRSVPFVATLAAVVVGTGSGVLAQSGVAAHSGSTPRKSAIQHSHVKTVQFYARVPPTAGLPLSTAYARLHRVGLQVAFPHRWSAGSDTCEPIVAGERPSAGKRLRLPSTVTLTPRPSNCGVSSPGVPTGPLPRARVPNLVGRPLSVVERWARRHGLGWEAPHLPPLDIGVTTTLLDSYIVVAQRPRPGSWLKLGIRYGNGAFLPTPLRLKTVALHPA
jgi:hypothetical protein